MDTLTQLQIFADSGLLILIWIVQLIIYPSFHYIEDLHFKEWHTRYTATIGLIVAPLMLLQVGIEGMFFFQQEMRLQRIFLIAVIWVATFFFSVPYHRELNRSGKNGRTINRLLRTNWIRTLCWSLLFLQILLFINGKNA